MKLGAIPETLVERLAIGLGLVPRPLAETLPTLLLTRSLMVSARFGLPQALADGALGAEEVASRCRTHPRATRILLDTLASLEYVKLSEGRYELTGDGRKWLLSLHDSLLYRYLEWDWIARLDDFVRTGETLDIHGEMTSAQWALYQRGMADVARLGIPEQAQRIPVPAGACDLLDIGGSHGLLSAALCRKHPGLRAVVLDLPKAVEHAAPILAREGMGDRVAHRPGNALTDDLGTEAWDVVLLSNLAHHFDDATNRELARRIARALRPGGVFAIVEIFRRESPTESGQVGALFDLYFALTSESGTWSFEEMAAWQRDAGLRPRKPVRLRRSPGFGIQIAVAR
ncbi:MAG TPA: class I SAM-dependent methyltransferase [Thermoanaerobaculia bacterium]|nr:class I SAM-dependent methyltransferase [Thermoanaerobaculia bacterium]